MARTRKSVLGDNPFASGQEQPAGKGASGSRRRPPKSGEQRGGSQSKGSGTKGKGKRTKASEADAAAETPAKGHSKSGSTRSPKPASKQAASRAGGKNGSAKTSTKPGGKRSPAKSSSSSPKSRDAKPSPKPKRKPDRPTTAPAPRATPVVDAGQDHDRPPTHDGETAADELIREAEKRRIAEEVRHLENRADDLSANAGTLPPTSTRDSEPSVPLGIELPGAEDSSMFETARGLLSSDYYLRQWGRLGMRNRSEEVDDFGHDGKYDARFQPMLDLLYDRYFRVQIEGIEHVPSEKRALIVANHAGTFPYDGIMLKTALRREHPSGRSVRWLTEDHLFYMPFVGSFLNRLGAVRACQENAERLLEQERLVAVFPEGAKGTGRLFRHRHKLQRFGRGGFIRLCLRTRTPVIPCVIAGAEESMPLLFRIEYLANVLGIPYIPITPTFPLLGPLGIIPAPTKWQFVFGEPVGFDRYGPEAADDHVLVRRLTERVRATMQGMMEQANASRRFPWFG